MLTIMATRYLILVKMHDISELYRSYDMRSCKRVCCK
jgi:hypothetical protein